MSARRSLARALGAEAVGTFALVFAGAAGQEVETYERPGLVDASASESDRYEELLVNPTLIILARQRGEIDCDGLRFLVVGTAAFTS